MTIQTHQWLGIFDDSDRAQYVFDQLNDGQRHLSLTISEKKVVFGKHEWSASECLVQIIDGDPLDRVKSHFKKIEYGGQG